MAEEKKEEQKETKEPVAAAPAPKAKGSRNVIIIVAAVFGLLVLAGVPIAMSKMKKNDGVAAGVSVDVAKSELYPAGKSEDGSEENLELEEGETPLGAVAPMDPFVANLRGGRFLKLEVQIAFSDKDIPSRWTTRSALLRDAVVTLLTRKRADEILADSGVEVLKKEIKEVLNEALKKELVQDVYVTQIVVQ